MEILALLDKLETLVTTSGRIPATKKAVVDQDKMLDLVDQIRLAMPKAIQDAGEILAEAKRRSDMLLQDTQRKTYQMTQEAQQCVNEARNYAQDILSRLEQQLSALLNSIRRAQDTLDAGKQPETPVGKNGVHESTTPS